VNNLKNLLDRIDAEMSIQEERTRRRQQERVDAFETRQRRYRELLQPTVSRLKKLWLPRLRLFAEKFQVLATKFGESVKITPEIGTGHDLEHTAQVVFVCESAPAQIQLKFGFSHDFEFRELVMEYDLTIIPVFLKFEPQARHEQKIESFDEDRSAQWLDDRIVDFIRTYLAIHENATYVADRMVEDPIAQIRFPKYAAKSTLQKEGITYYFISNDTKCEFQNGCSRG
jgi:YHS domain-containing protein